MMDIIQKFMNLKDGKTLIFPRYHQLDVVRRLLADVRQNGAGYNYLIQHSAGSGKSNSIAWTAYRLASLFNAENKPVFSSVVVVTDRTVLDAQLQETISGFDHTLGAIETIGEDKTSKDLRDAINGGVRIIVTTLQKFPVIYQEVDKVAGRNFAIIVDEAHSSQTGSSALKLKAALADTEDALREYAEIEGKAEEELDPDDRLMREMTVHGRHKNLSFFAFTATPKDKTLELFGTEYEDVLIEYLGSYAVLGASGTCPYHTSASSSGSNTMVENTLIPDAKILLSQAYAQLQSMDIVNDAQRYSAIQSAITNLEYVISLPAPTTAEVASAMGQLTQAMAGIY